MSELSKQKEIGENMSDSRQLTTLVKELDNTLRTVKSVDEYLSRIAKAKEVLGKDSVELSEIIENNKNNLETLVGKLNFRSENFSVAYSYDYNLSSDKLGSHEISLMFDFHF